MRSDPQRVGSGEEAEEPEEADEPESAATGAREGVKDRDDYPPDLPHRSGLCFAQDPDILLDERVVRKWLSRRNRFRALRHTNRRRPRLRRESLRELRRALLGLLG